MFRYAVLSLLIACGDSTDSHTVATCGTHAGGGLADFDIPCDPGGEGLYITASGEAFAKDGYPFPPTDADAVFFVDGWEIAYDHVITTVDHVTLSSGPDKSDTDQSLCDDGHGGTITCGTGSSVVAAVDGPFALDLHNGGPLDDADGAPMDATPIGALAGLDPTTKYAFGFEVVPALAQAKNVNLDDAGVTAYQQMIAKGYTTLLVGTATWKGADCTQTAAYDFTVLPTTIHFQIGLDAPTTYRNAQNPALQGEPHPNEENPRGVVVVANQSTIAQVTLHIDHAFWESFVHDSPAHFDSFAAKYAGSTTANLVLEDFKGYAFTPFVDAQGHQLPWRSCVSSDMYTPPGDGAMSFDTLTVPVDPTGDPASVIRDFYDYTTYNHSTFGHLNADGLSFVDRNYPSPK
ncbi:MAG: hypothetical protein QM831_20320 [Kofleriaceae bacterium]